MTDLMVIDLQFTVTEPVYVRLAQNIKGLCTKPYPGHPRGCPNWANKPGCPPQTPDWFDRYEGTVRLAVMAFDFESYLNMMRLRHPGWTDRQLRNPLYWQGFVRKRFFEMTQMKRPAGYQAVFTPEALGVDVTAICELAGIRLEWPPMHWVRMVACYAIPKATWRNTY